MLYKDFPEANFTFTKPQDMTDEECGSLRVFRGADTEGHAVSISCWQPSYEDIERIKEGKPIWLYVYGLGHPPVALATERPWPIEEKEQA